MHTHILPIPDSPFLFSCIMLAYAWIPTRRWFRYYGFGRRQPTKDSSKGGRKEFVSFKTDPSNTTCDSKRRKSGGVTPTPRNKYNESNDVITNASTNLKRPQPLGRESSSSEVLHHQQQQQQQQHQQLSVQQAAFPDSARAGGGISRQFIVSRTTSLVERSNAAVMSV